MELGFNWSVYITVDNAPHGNPHVGYGTTPEEALAKLLKMHTDQLTLELNAIDILKVAIKERDNTNG